MLHTSFPLSIVLLDKKEMIFLYEAPIEEQNFETVLAFIDASEVREEDENFKNAVDYMFDALEKEKPNHFAVKQYKKYKLAAGVIELRRTLHHYLSERCFA